MEEQSMELNKDNIPFSSLNKEKESIVINETKKSKTPKKNKTNFEYDSLSLVPDAPNIVAFNVQNPNSSKDEISIEELGNNHKNKLMSFLTCCSLYRFSSLISSFIFIASLLVSIYFYYFDSKEDKTQKIIVTFQFKTEAYIPFQLNEISFLIFISIIILFIISFIFCIIKNDYRFQSPFKEDLAVFFPWILFFISVSFIIRLIYNDNHLLINLIILVLYAFCMLMASCIYKKSKSRRNQSIIILINESFLISIVLCFVSYVLLFTLFEVIPLKTTDIKSKNNISILFNILLTSIALILLTTYKDIIFTLSFFIVEAGIFSYNKEILCRENMSIIIIVSFMFISMVYTVGKFKEKVFGYEQDGEIIVNIEQNHSS